MSPELLLVFLLADRQRRRVMGDFEKRGYSSLKEYSGELKTAPFQARRMLQIAPIDDSMMRYLEGRDARGAFNVMPKKPNDNILTKFPIQTEGDYTAVSLKARDVDLGYMMAGIYKEGGKTVGEIAMVRIAPAIEGLGAGSVLMHYGLEHLLDRKHLDVLRLEIADRLGRVERFSLSWGFEQTARIQDMSSRGIRSNKIAELSLSRGLVSELAERASIASNMGMNRLSANEDFWHRVDRVESEPPLGNLGDVVAEGLIRSNFRGPGLNHDVVYYGHQGGPVRAALVRAGGSQTAVEVFVRGTSPGEVRQLMGPKLNGFALRGEDFGLGEKFAGVVLRGTVGRQSEALEDLKPMATLSAELIQRLEAEKFVGG